jgi:hypothetical protein
VTDVLLESANLTLRRKGYAPEEARVSPAPDVSPNHGRLHGTLLVREETDLVARLVSLIDWLPSRDDLVDLSA